MLQRGVQVVQAIEVSNQDWSPGQVVISKEEKVFKLNYYRKKSGKIPKCSYWKPMLGNWNWKDKKKKPDKKLSKIKREKRSNFTTGKCVT